MEEVKYRIKELNGKFTIEIYAYKEKGMIWWKSKEWNWYRTNSWGGVLQFYPKTQPSSTVFSSLKNAKKQVKKWRATPIYHEL